MDELYSVCWNLTNKCNETCKFCYRKICKDNSLAENKKIFDNISKVKIGKITFAGGEPLLYDELFELVDYVREKNPNIILSLTTNGKMIDDYLIEEIIKRFDWISFPVDSSNNSINQEIGRGIQHLSNITQLLEKFNNRIKIKVNTVVNKYNLNDLYNIWEIISKYNISRWKTFRFYPSRDAKMTKDLFYISDFESDKVQKTIMELSNGNSNIKIQYNDTEEIATSYFSIYPDGSIENRYNENVGNLLNDSISDILKIKSTELQNHNLRKNYV